MKKIYLFAFALSLSLLFTGKVFSQCTEVNEPKVLLVGDSWAFFMLQNNTFNTVFSQWGFSNYKYISNGHVAINGSETPRFMEAKTQDSIRVLINRNPSIEAVHLSIGGNDFLGDWKVSYTQGRTDTLQNEVFERLDSIVRFLKTCKPGIRIVWSGYVYPNFGELVPTYPFLPAVQHPMESNWAKMENPTFIQLNTILNNVSARMETYAANDPQVEFVMATGLLQYLHGQTTALAVAPGGTYAPFSVSMPLGDPNYPSPKTCMNDYGFFVDCFHLSPQSYRELISYQTQKFYHKFLMDDLYMLSDSSAKTGSVSSTGNISDSLFIGGSANEQFATMLSFNTTNMADTSLSGASIFLRRQNLAGTNPVSGTMQIKIKNGNLGTTADVEAADFTAAGDADATPCLFGSNTANGDWIRLDLPASISNLITRNAQLQFALSAPGATAGKTTFYNTSDPESAPVLNLKYKKRALATGINETAPVGKFAVYPNPTNGKLTVEREGEIITRIDVSNLLGETVLKPKMQDNTIDISSLANGMYILNITTQSGSTSQRIIKN